MLHCLRFFDTLNITKNPSIQLGKSTDIFWRKAMESTYFIEELRTDCKNENKEGVRFNINEGDVILDKGFRLELLPKSMDFTKPISRKKVSRAPMKISERLLRIKTLEENFAVVAVLHQESYIEDGDIMVEKEEESLKTVNYGEKFYVYAKQQAMDSFGGITFCFAITNTAQSSKKQQKFCAECGARLTAGDKFCRECGAPLKKSV